MKDKKTINADAAKAASDDIHASSIPNEIKLMVQLANSCQVVVEDVFNRIKGVYARHGFRHELAMLAQGCRSDLAAWLVASLHGKIGLSIRSLPGED